MYTQIDHFRKAFAGHREATGKIFAALTDASLEQAVQDDHRTLGGMAWHIVTTIPEMMKQTGLALSAIDAESRPPANAETIQAGYETATTELLTAIDEHWTDETLAEVDEMYGEKWPRGLTLVILLNHEIHHRGQMTVLMRQAGLKVPGIYGPAQEEWGVYGMETPAY